MADAVGAFGSFGTGRKAPRVSWGTGECVAIFGERLGPIVADPPAGVVRRPDRADGRGAVLCGPPDAGVGGPPVFPGAQHASARAFSVLEGTPIGAGDELEP